MGKYSGTVKKTYKIRAKNLKTFNLEADVRLSGSLAPGGMPAVTLYDASNERYMIPGADYTVSYQNTANKAVGSTAKITITGKRNYTGKIVKRYTLATDTGSGTGA